MDIETPVSDMSGVIREFGRVHGVFGSDEIRQRFGQKAAMLVPQIAHKGHFIRIANGVYAVTELADFDQAYVNYLKRLDDDLAERVNSGVCSVADRLFLWASEQPSFTVKQANDHFGQPMKAFIANYLKRGRFELVEKGSFRYVGYKPSRAVSSPPLLLGRRSEREAVLSALIAGAQTADQLVKATGLQASYLVRLLDRLVHEGIVERKGEASAAGDTFFCLPTKDDLVVEDADLCALAYLVSFRQATIFELSRAKFPEPARYLRRLVELGLARAIDVPLSGPASSFEPTPSGELLLEEKRFFVGDVPILAFRPMERTILNALRTHGALTYGDLHTRFFQNGGYSLVCTAGRRLYECGLVDRVKVVETTLSITALGLKSFGDLNC